MGAGTICKYLRLAALEIQLAYLVMALTLLEGLVWIAQYFCGEAK